MMLNMISSTESIDLLSQVSLHARTVTQHVGRKNRIGATYTGTALTSVNRMTAPTITPTISVPEAPRVIDVDTAAACRTNRVL